MDIDTCKVHLRNAILAIYPVHEKALVDIQQLFIPETISAKEYFCKAGDYSLYFAFICDGLFQSFYRDTKNTEHCTGFYCNNMFMLPLPSFLYRKPVFQFFHAIKKSTLIKIKYADMENLARKHSSVNDFLRTLIDREWIVKKEQILAEKYLYDHQTRFQLFNERFRDQFQEIPIASISSFLNIPEKQLYKLIEKEKKAE